MRPEHAYEIKLSELTDDHRVVEVCVKGTPTRLWDDGFGPLWVYRESFGVLGVVRARTYEDAYTCVVDEIMDDATWADVEAARGGAAGDAPVELPEGFEYRSSGVPSNPALKSAIASFDLNYSSLDSLTPELVDEHGLTIWVID
ncbi:MAG: hypothetical protein IPH13_20050 [Planctomycetes bacterium]|nr:hypothetical protein [Planctomycetota bacterium]